MVLRQKGEIGTILFSAMHAYMQIGLTNQYELLLETKARYLKSKTSETTQLVFVTGFWTVIPPFQRILFSRLAFESMFLRFRTQNSFPEKILEITSSSLITMDLNQVRTSVRCFSFCFQVRTFLVAPPKTTVALSSYYSESPSLLLTFFLIPLVDQFQMKSWRSTMLSPQSQFLSYLILTTRGNLRVFQAPKAQLLIIQAALTSSITEFWGQLMQQSGLSSSLGFHSPTKYWGLLAVALTQFFLSIFLNWFNSVQLYPVPTLQKGTTWLFLLLELSTLLMTPRRKEEILSVQSDPVVLYDASPQYPPIMMRSRVSLNPQKQSSLSLIQLADLSLGVQKELGFLRIIPYSFLPILLQNISVICAVPDTIQPLTISNLPGISFTNFDSIPFLLTSSCSIRLTSSLSHCTHNTSNILQHSWRFGLDYLSRATCLFRPKGTMFKECFQRTSISPSRTQASAYMLDLRIGMSSLQMWVQSLPFLEKSLMSSLVMWTWSLYPSNLVSAKYSDPWISKYSRGFLPASIGLMG